MLINMVLNEKESKRLAEKHSQDETIEDGRQFNELKDVIIGKRLRYKTILVVLIGWAL